MAVTFDYLNSSVAAVVRSSEAALQARIAALDPATASPVELLLLQTDVSKWTMMTQIQSTLTKELSDAMKGIIQKSG